MNAQEEKLFMLMEQAEQLQEAAALQSESVKKAAKSIEALGLQISGPLIREASKEISAAVAKETGEQLKQLCDALLESKSDVKERRLNVWLTLIGAAVLGLFVVSWGAWLAYRATDAERATLAALKQEVAEAQETLKKLGTWGVKLEQNQNGVRWIALPRGWKFGQTAIMGKDTAAVFIQKK